ncbi:hypothetical protein D3C84_951360 [compost metagenome]
MRRPPSIPTNAPVENGMATAHCKCPAAELAATPEIETSAMTARDVASTDCAVRLVYRWSAGTITKPPPTPSKPESPPATTPETVSAHAHGPVQLSFPRFTSNRQGGGLDVTGGFDSVEEGSDR